MRPASRSFAQSLGKGVAVAQQDVHLRVPAEPWVKPRKTTDTIHSPRCLVVLPSVETDLIETSLFGLFAFQRPLLLYDTVKDLQQAHPCNTGSGLN